MKRIIVTGVLLATGVAGLIAQPPAAGRGAAAPPATAPAAAAPAAPAGPAPKSPEELKALQAIVAAQQANNPDGMIAASEDLLTKFADTDFKELAYTSEGLAYEAKKNPERAEIQWGRVLQVNPKNVQAHLSLAELIIKRTGEKDLDRDEKLTDAQKHLDNVFELVKGPKPNPQMTDQQWAETGQGLSAQAHNDLATMAVIRAGAFKDDQKKYYDQAVSEFQLAVQQDPQPAYEAKLASALLTAGKPTEAAALCDKILATPDLHPQIKSFVDRVKAAATPKAPAAK